MADKAVGYKSYFVTLIHLSYTDIALFGWTESGTA
jgi:hypothetical protein